MAHGTIHWNELATPDVAAARAYYQATCGWTFDEMPMPNGTYTICKAGDQMVGGMMDIKGLDNPDVPPHWMTYIAVDDIDKVCAQTTAAGGTVANGPFEVPGVGRIAMIKDPTGAMIGMMTPSGD